MNYKELSATVKNITNTHIILNGQYIYTGLNFVVLDRARQRLTGFTNPDRVNVRCNQLIDSLEIQEATWQNLKKYAQKFGFITLTEKHHDLKFFPLLNKYKWKSPDVFDVDFQKMNEFITEYTTEAELDSIINQVVENALSYDIALPPQYKWLREHLLTAKRLGLYSGDSIIAYQHYDEYMKFLNTKIKYEGPISKQLEKARKRILKEELLQANIFCEEYAPLLCRWIEANCLKNKDYQALNYLIEYTNDLRSSMDLLNFWNRSRCSIRANIKQTKNGCKIRNGGRTTSPLCNTKKTSKIRQNLKKDYTTFDLHSAIQTVTRIENKREFDPDWSFKNVLAEELHKDPKLIKDSAICYRLSYGFIGAQYLQEKSTNWKNYSYSDLKKAQNIFNREVGKTNSRLINIRESIFEILVQIYELHKKKQIENIYDEFYIRGLTEDEFKKDLVEVANYFLTYIDDFDSLDYLLYIMS